MDVSELIRHDQWLSEILERPVYFLNGSDDLVAQSAVDSAESQWFQYYTDLVHIKQCFTIGPAIGFETEIVEPEANV